jgi:hypothetical protein
MAQYINEDFNWTDKPIIGAALLIMEGEIDSNNQSIKPMSYYKVGKHKRTGKVIIKAWK